MQNTVKVFKNVQFLRNYIHSQTCVELTEVLSGERVVEKNDTNKGMKSKSTFKKTKGKHICEGNISSLGFLKFKCRCHSFKVNGHSGAPYTPMKTNGEVNFDFDFVGCTQYLRKVQKFECLFVNGTSGESVSLTVDERKELARKWKTASFGKIPMILHIGTGNLKDTKLLARDAQELGVEAITMVSPSYFRPRDEEAIVDYIRDVTSAAPNVPMFYYSIDFMTNVYLNDVKVMTLGREKVPTLVGMKFTTSDLVSASNCMQIDSKLQILVGTDTMTNMDNDHILMEVCEFCENIRVFKDGLESGVHSWFVGLSVSITFYTEIKGIIKLFLPCLSLGLDKPIMSPFLGSLFHNTKESFEKGNIEKARDIQKSVFRINSIRMKYGTSFSIAKAMFSILSGYDVGPVRLPLTDMTQNEKEQLRDDLKENNFV